MDGGTGLAKEATLAKLSKQAEGLTGAPLLEFARETFGDRLAVVSSFAAESAVLLHLVARVDPGIPVIFLETGKHFPETLMYRDRLVGRLRLSDVRSVRPQPAEVEESDPDGRLWASSTDMCCHLRKVLPLERALTGFDAWVTGRKRFQGGTRKKLGGIERDGGRFKINPLAAWSKDEIDAAFAESGLPRHPLVAEGYPSIGCLPCTRRPAEGEDERAGRWAGQTKTECGIHKVWWAQSGDGSSI